ncbi:metallophosphoesterase family protein [Haloplanus rubicundus]|uniref:Phosphoesterase n=1 Tax=Haloplanus rubicundus TaxID=1547898 RepID=A0A345E899_9EURY|nr:metallophosphoesterase family protein [Haloplanus rubicundus]AXG08421.1 metallophosphoesterase [Haloplanus rubicundus]
MTDSVPTTVGLIADVHANLPALDGVLNDMPDLDALVHAGDIIGYGPWPNACVERLRKHDAVSVRGNHDQTVIEGRAYESSDRYAQDNLTDENLSWIEACPDKRALFEDRVVVVHGHPDDRFRYTEASNFSADLLGEEDVLVLGHTHQQAKAEYDNGIVVNPGSIGQPRDGDERAAYAVLDLTARTVELRRVPYDIDRLVEKIEESSISAYHTERYRHAE